MQTEEITMLEFMLPQTKVVSEFFSLPEKEKIEIIELGMFLHKKKNEKKLIKLFFKAQDCSSKKKARKILKKYEKTKAVTNKL